MDFQTFKEFCNEKWGLKYDWRLIRFWRWVSIKYKYFGYRRIDDFLEKMEKVEIINSKVLKKYEKYFYYGKIQNKHIIFLYETKNNKTDDIKSDVCRMKDCELVLLAIDLFKGVHDGGGLQKEMDSYKKCILNEMIARFGTFIVPNNHKIYLKKESGLKLLECENLKLVDILYRDGDIWLVFERRD